MTLKKVSVATDSSAGEFHEFLLITSLIPDRTLQGAPNVDKEQAVTTQERNARRILIVDDDEAFCALCARYLRRAPDQDYVSQSVTLASEGISRCLEQSFDCLIVDYRLPDGTGTEMLQLLNNTLHENMPPAIVLTAGGGEEAAKQAIRVQAADYMAKPEVSRTSLTRALENAIEKATLKRSVIEQNKQLTVANAELQKNADEIRQFYQNVSHEVKTPLTAVQEFLRLLSEEVCGPITPQQAEVLEYALSGCSQIALHFNDLLDITRLDTGKITIRRSYHSVPTLVQQCILAAKPEAQSRGITIVNQVNPQTPMVLLDPKRYIQIIANLLTNAIKFSTENGVITLASDHSDHWFNLTVSDTGCGIDEQSIHRIFDRLYQVPLGGEDDASSDGLGLGLAISREISRLHGGELSVKSTPGVGSVFTISIPNERSAECAELIKKAG